MGLVTMSERELDRVGVIEQVLRRELAQTKAAEMLALTPRQVRRLCAAYERLGPAGLVSRKRGRPSNHRLSTELEGRALELVRDRYRDFGPTFAREKLAEVHGLEVGRETLRKWMLAAGLWSPKASRKAAPHQPRNRRSCLGELVQIDGSPHHWFEERGVECTLLVYVDDATGALMELRFVDVESAFDYFAATRSYLQHHGRPVAFYSDKHSIFRVAHEGTTGPDEGVTQFGRALAELNIDIICANSPQAKGRVERMNQTLQDRLVKELRLRGISNRDEANQYAPVFMADFNSRFARPPAKAHDAHRPLRPEHDLDHIFTWQEDRTVTKNLVVHFHRASYLLTPTSEACALAGHRVGVSEREDGVIEIWADGRLFPYSILGSQAHIEAAAIVENKRLDVVLAVVKAAQAKRDQEQLESKHVTRRGKARIRAAQDPASIPDNIDAMATGLIRAQDSAKQARERESHARHDLALREPREKTAQSAAQPPVVTTEPPATPSRPAGLVGP